MLQKQLHEVSGSSKNSSSSFIIRSWEIVRLEKVNIFKQEEPNDLIRDLALSKETAEVLVSGIVEHRFLESLA